MDRLFENIMNLISDNVYNLSRNIFDSIDSFIKGNRLTIITNYLFVVSIGLVITILLYQIWRQRYFKNDFSIIQRLLRKKELVYTSLFLIFICLSQKIVMDFTFNFWNSIFKESSIVDVLKQSSEQVTTQNITWAMVSILSSALSLIIAFSQLMEVLSLQLMCLITPVILVYNFFNKEVSSIFISSLIKGILSPIMQTFTMYIVLSIMTPIILSKMEVCPLMKSVFILISIFQGFKMTEILMDIFKSFKNETEVNSNLNLVKSELKTGM